MLFTPRIQASLSSDSPLPFLTSLLTVILFIVVMITQAHVVVSVARCFVVVFIEIILCGCLAGDERTRLAVHALGLITRFFIHISAYTVHIIAICQLTL